MTDAQTTRTKSQETAPEAAAVPQGRSAGVGRPRAQRAARRNTERPSRRSRRGGGERARPEFEHELLDVRRVARVVAGGRRFSFAVAVVAGDRKGRVGVGTGKAQDTTAAMEKALRDAKKNLIFVQRTADGSIPHEVSAKFKASSIALRPAPGRGLVAGSAARVVLNLAGVTDVSAKLHARTKNKLAVAQAAVAALRKLVAPVDPKRSSARQAPTEMAPSEKRSASQKASRRARKPQAGVPQIMPND
ncbi:MAG: hypothetical protein KatS3mg099_442 [Candidatus Parcubacteria bacterium]|nr:MAG: hypothetical protein KatS3mg099_442 [Candidatus Parcubacteria bacterium]